MIIRVIKSRRMKWTGHVARTREMRNVVNILVATPEVKNKLEELDVDERIILEWILEKWGENRLF
jgi:hypothetical protein